MGAASIGAPPALALYAASVFAAAAIALPGGARAQDAQAPEQASLTQALSGRSDIAQATTPPADGGDSAKRANGKSEPPKYVDQLIDPSLEGADDGLSLEEREEGAQPLGRRFTAAEARRFQRSYPGSNYTENGLVLQHRRETQDFGQLSLDVQGRDARETGAFPLYGGTKGGGQFQLQQFRFPLTSSLFMNNAVGAVRLGPNPLLGNSYRVQLPSVVASGAQSVTYRDEREFRVYSGRVGRLTGAYTQAFEQTEGEVLGLGYLQQLAPRWSAGIQLVDFRDSSKFTDNRSAAFAAQYDDRRAGRQIALRGLSDNQGGRGFWADGVETDGLWQHRYGAYRQPANLLWVDRNIGSDSQGLYARTEYRTQVNSVAVGADLLETNPNGDPSRSGIYARSVYSTLYHRVSRDTFLNGSAAVSDTDGKALPVQSEDSTSFSASAGVGQRFALGLSNFRVFAGKTRSAAFPRHSYGATWDHAWDIRHWYLSTALTYQKEDAAGVASERKGASANFRTTVAGTASFDGGLQYGRAQSDTGLSTDNFGGNLNVNWTLSAHWSSRLQLLWNRAEPSFGSANGPTLTEKSLFIALRAEDVSGRPIVTQGRQTGSIGSGRIVGWVFLDENNDGVRQASERPAAGVIVYLDGRYSTTTDSEGRFEFVPVPTGDHTLRMSVENVPLPWGLLDESPRRIDVPLRDAATVEVPLSRIAQ